ncbi:MAG: hypothetical protein JF564_02920 [Sphingomonas sp.]|nr:hypothetical protein [Sphingomonas sp.]
MKRIVLAIGLLGVAACQKSPADKAADQLDNAAAQSDPAAAETLENAADALRDNDDANVAAAVQNAMSAAGTAQAPVEQPGGPTQAKPHEAGDPVPPPQTKGR